MNNIFSFERFLKVLKYDLKMRVPAVFASFLAFLAIPHALHVVMSFGQTFPVAQRVDLYSTMAAFLMFFAPFTIYSSFNNSNIPDFDNEALTTYITNAQQASDIGTITDNVNNCEQNIIDSHCVCPMIFESSYYASAKGVKNIQFHAGSGRVSFVNATRED